MASRIYIVDVFAEQPRTGNQLAVVIAAEELSERAMLEIAAEMNFSETAFVNPAKNKDGTYGIRLFTPAKEIAFAGHPILGAAWVVRQFIEVGTPALIRLNLTVGQVPVSFEPDEAGKEVAWFLSPPSLLERTSTPDAIAAALGLLPEDIDADLPVQIISAGTSAVIVPIRSLDALRRSRLDLSLFAPLLSQGFPPLIYLFTRQTHHPENDFCARFFFEAHGVREDPATGNGAAFLGAYLLEHRFFPSPTLRIRIEQGYEVRRPSLVMVRGRRTKEVQEVSVGGCVIPILRGELL